MPLGFTAITPAQAITSGQILVEITGTDFDITTAADPVSMEVEIAGRKCTKVGVRAQTGPPNSILQCVIPRAPLLDRDPVTEKPIIVKAFDVKLTNLVVPATVTAVDAFTYSRPNLVEEVHQTTVVRALIDEMRNQIFHNIHFSSHTDFDPDTLDLKNMVEVAQLPSITLLGPQSIENRFYSLNRLPERSSGSPLIFETFREPRTVDLIFVLQGLSESIVQANNMMNRVALFFHQNKFLFSLIDPSDPGKGEIKHEMDILPGEDPKLRSATGNSNLKIFDAQFMIRGVDLDELTSIRIDKSAEVLTIEPTVDDSVP